MNVQLAPALRRVCVHLKLSTADVLTLAQLGDALDAPAFVGRVLHLVISSYVPRALRAAAGAYAGDVTLRGWGDDRASQPARERVLRMADTCESEPTREHVQEAADAANVYAQHVYRSGNPAAAYAAAATCRAGEAAEAFADSEVYEAADYAGSAIACTARCIGAAAFARSRDKTRASATRDKVRADFAQELVQVLREMRYPATVIPAIAPRGASQEAIAMFGYREERGWLVDENNNRVSIEQFGSREAAEKALASLKNCRNCVNCSHCSDCLGCSNSSYCSGCSGCSGCLHCKNCENCVLCQDCADCEGCSNCTHCSGCWRCTHCSHCSGDHGRGFAGGFL